MIRSIVILALGAASALAIDFTPIVPQNESPQMRRFPRLLFKDGTRTASYVPPAGWTYSGNPAGLRLEASDPSRSLATIQEIVRKNPKPFDPETVESLATALMTAVPAGSTDVRVMSKEQNPLRIGGAETLEIAISYFAVGKVRMRSVLFVNLPATQLQFSLSSLQAEFPAAHDRFRRSYYSWQWLD